MVTATAEPTTKTLSLPEELMLMLLNEESGYFHQVSGWDLNCTVMGAVLAELSLLSRIDTDLQSLILLDGAETGDPALDPVLKEIANDPEPHNAQYWIERLAPRAESIIDLTLDRLVDENILQRHDGDFWTLSRTARHGEFPSGSEDGTAAEFVRTRISRVIFNNVIPSPRDVIIIALVNTCDVLRFMFELDDEAEERIELICRLDLIARSIVDAVGETVAGPLLRRPALTKEIPSVPLRRLLLNPNLRKGNLPAVFGELAEEYGPVFKLNVPFQDPMIFLAGPETNRWAHRHGRMYLRARDYMQDFEKLYGAAGLIQGLDGADHFRMRKAMQPGYSRARLEGQLDVLLHNGRAHMATWEVGASYSGRSLSRELVNAEISPLVVSVDSQDIISDLLTFKERALSTHVAGILPKFMLRTPGMRTRSKVIDRIVDRIQRSHTPAQRAGCPRDLADDLLSLHASDPQFLPETNMKFLLSAPLLASMYQGDAFSFVAYFLFSQPELRERVQREADALFANGDPTPDDLNTSALDVTHRVIMESLRLNPVVPVSIRNVMNTCVVENFELRDGVRVYIAQTASHYMKDVFPDPWVFDIDRYLPPREEHRSPGYAPFGLGTHTCLGSRWVELQMAVNLLLLAHYFDIEVTPSDSIPPISPFPSMSLGKKAKFVITGKRRELPV